MSEQIEPVDNWLQKAAERMQNEIAEGAAPDPEKITVRQFLERFGYYRRKQGVVNEIQKMLNKYCLKTNPNFEQGDIDNFIALQLKSPQDYTPKRKSFDRKVRIGILKAANSGVVSVTPDDTLSTATTRMRMKGYSQLPVMRNERDVKGVVSWRSIGEAYLHGHKPTTVGECKVKVHEVDTNTMLADATEEIYKHGYVLVRGEDRRITGIVTGEDLALQYKKLSYPFLLVGEIEHHLRDLVRGRFTVKELNEVSNGTRQVDGPDDLTFGSFCRLLQNKEFWDRLGLEANRKEFAKQLDLIREIRNDIMHFSLEENDSERIEELRASAQFLRNLAVSQEKNSKSGLP